MTRGHLDMRRLITWLCASLALALLTTVCATGAMVAQAAVSGQASSCGGGANVSPPPASASGPRITLGHASGPVGMAEDVSGTGWPAGAQVSIDLDILLPDGTFAVMLRSLASPTADRDGAFRSPGFTLPDLGGCADGASGTRVYFVAHNPDGKYTSKAAFLYTAQPLVFVASNPQLQPGDVVSLSSSNWEPGESVTVSLSVRAPDPTQNGANGTPETFVAVSQPLPNGTLHVQADRQGAWRTSFTLPDTLVPRSTLAIQATGDGPLYGTVVAPEITVLVAPAVLPTLALDRTSGTVTDAITVRGTQWYPGDTVAITYCRGQTVIPDAVGLHCDPNLSAGLASVTVDPSGDFATSVRLPPEAQTGPITIQALVPHDPFGVSVYARSVAFTIEPPPLPWYRVHPRLAFAVTVLKPAMPALVLAVLLIAVYLWHRLRHRRTYQTEAPAPFPGRASDG